MKAQDTIPKIYYRYFTPDSVYYYDTVLGTTGYNFPNDGIVLDPFTRSPIQVDYFSNPEYQKLLDQYYQATNESEQIANFSDNVVINHIKRKVSLNQIPIDDEQSSNSETDMNDSSNSESLIYNEEEVEENDVMEKKDLSKVHYMPDDFYEILKKYENCDYTDDYLNEYNNGNLFNKKYHTSIYQIIKFSPLPIKHSLLKLPNQNLDDKAVKCFQLILDYSGVSKTQSDESAQKLIKIIEKNPEIVDEVYFQLVKQTRRNINLVWELKTWKLFLIVASIFPSSKQNCEKIKAHIAYFASKGNHEISEICQFLFITFYTRCEINGIDKELLSTNPNDILNRMDQEHCDFNSSIYHFLWCQRKKYPDLPIPIIAYKMVKSIFEKDVINTVGPFRLPGNLANVQKIIQEINKGNYDAFQSAPIHDLLSLFKQWFGDIQVPICPCSSLPSFKKASLSIRMDEYDHYIQSYLPKSHIRLLGFLIGFLKEICRYQDVTKMNTSNLSVVFAPSIIRVPDDIDGPEILLYSKYSIMFVNFLLSQWNTLEYYPLDFE